MHIFFFNSKQQDSDKDDKSSTKTEDRKRKRSPSPREEAPRAPPIARPENEPMLDENKVLLSWCKYQTNYFYLICFVKNKILNFC